MVFARAEIREDLEEPGSKHYVVHSIYINLEPRAAGFSELKFTVQEESTTQSNSFHFVAEGSYRKRGNRIFDYKIKDKHGDAFEPDYEQLCQWFKWLPRF